MMLTEFTIDRSTWACGSNNQVRDGKSLLEDDQGFKCCLGFYATACELPTKYDLPEGPAGFGVLSSIPSDLLAASKLVNPALVFNQSDFIATNDSRCISNSEREFKLTNFFAKYGVTVHFIGEYL